MRIHKVGWAVDITAGLGSHLAYRAARVRERLAAISLASARMASMRCADLSAFWYARTLCILAICPALPAEVFGLYR